MKHYDFQIKLKLNAFKKTKNFRDWCPFNISITQAVLKLVLIQLHWSVVMQSLFAVSSMQAWWCSVASLWLLPLNFNVISSQNPFYTAWHRVTDRYLACLNISGASVAKLLHSDCVSDSTHYTEVTHMNECWFASDLGLLSVISTKLLASENRGKNHAVCTQQKSLCQSVYSVSNQC